MPTKPLRKFLCHPPNEKHLLFINSNGPYKYIHGRLLLGGLLKICTKCEKPLFIGCFDEDHGYFASQCRACRRITRKPVWAKQHAKRTPEESRLAANQYSRRLREEVIEAYGHKCACPGCTVTKFEFLAVDHIHGGGKAHREQISSGKCGTKFYRWLRDKGFPKDEFQLLCHNCNCAKGFYGKCPHQSALSPAVACGENQ